LIDMIKYIDQNPHAERPELLGHWAGHESHEELLRLSDRPLDIDDEALGAEFTDGVRRLLEQRRRNHRRELLDEMKRDPSDEKFRRFWSLKQGQEDGRRQ